MFTTENTHFTPAHKLIAQRLEEATKTREMPVICIDGITARDLLSEFDRLAYAHDYFLWAYNELGERFTKMQPNRDSAEKDLGNLEERYSDARTELSKQESKIINLRSTCRTLAKKNAELETALKNVSDDRDHRLKDDANEIDRLRRIIDEQHREMKRMRWENREQNKLLDEFLLTVEQVQEDTNNGHVDTDHLLAQHKAHMALLKFAREKAKIVP